MQIKNGFIKTIFKHSTIVLLFGASFLATKLSDDVSYQTFCNIITFELVALWLFYLVVYVFSPVNFISYLIEGFSNEEHIENTKTWYSIVVICTVLFSVHVLTGFCVWGIYFTHTKPVP